MLQRVPGRGTNRRMASVSMALAAVTVVLLAQTGAVDAQSGQGGGRRRDRVPGIGRISERSQNRAEERTSKFVLRVPKQRLSAIAGRYNLTIIARIEDRGRDVFLVSGPESVLNRNANLEPGAPLTQSLLQAVQGDPEVAHFEPNALVVTPETPTDIDLNHSTIEILDALNDRSVVPYYGMQAWNGYVNQPAVGAVRLPDSQGTGATGAGIVAIIDTGVDPEHPLLQGALVQGYDFTSDTEGIPSEWEDLDHSTIEILDHSTIEILDQAVAPVPLNPSTVAIMAPTPELNPSQLPPAFGHGTMVAGIVRLVAPTAKIMPLKAFNADGTSSVFDIVRAVYYAVDHGARVINMSFSSTVLSPELGRAINYATDRGVICVASAGNLGQETIVYPGGQRNVMGVASTTSTATPTRSSFSNYGDGLVSVGAPGEAVITTYPGGGYAGVWGTSFSAPMVAGGAALLLQIDPALDHHKAAALLGRALQMTRGMGKGRLNLFEAVRALPDATPPTVSFLTPASGGSVSGTVLLSASANDNVSVAGIKFLLNDQLLAPEDTAAPYEMPWSTSGVENGTHLLTVVARDGAGNLTTSASSVTVFNDGEPPVVALAGPAANAVITGTTTITATASDNGSISSVQFKLDGSALIGEDGSTPYEVSWNTVLATEGTHSLTAVARDGAGNETTSASIVVTVARDNVAPSVAITSPAAATTVGGTVAITANASDDIALVHVQFMLDGAPLGAPDTTAPFETSWSTAGATNGAHAVSAVARDTAGNETAAALVGVTVSNDTTAPTVMILNPTPAATVGDTVTVTAVATDDVGVASVQFLLDGAPLGAADTAAPFETAWATTAVANGPHAIGAVARDASGKETTAAAVDVNVINDGGPPTVTVTSPADATTIDGTVVVTATATDDVGVVSIQFLLDGATLGPSISAPPYQTSWLTSATPNGSHTLTAVARDAAGNTTNASAVTVNVLNDTAAPAVALTNPGAGATLSGMVMLNASASDDIAVTSVQFLLDGASLGTVTSAPYELLWSTTTVANGAHTLSAVARDAAGHEAVTTINLAVMNDVAPPTVSFASPANGAVVSGNLTVSANAADDVGVSMVRFLADGVSIAGADDAPPYESTWATTAAANGAHTLTAVARDSAGRETTATISVIVANDAAAPTVAVTGPAADSTVSGAVTVTATAADDIGVTSVQFLVDGAPLGAADTAAPYQAAWATGAVPNGAHTIAAVARDAVGHETTATAISVTVLNDIAAPTVSVTGPAANATVAGAVTVTANAADDIAITSVQFLLDGAPLGAADTAAPYEATWSTTSTANGAHTLTAVASDAVGNATTAASVSVLVSNDLAAPTVSVSAPAAGATVGGTVTVTANATDDVAVTSVQFMVDGVALGAPDSAAPYEAAWATTGTANGAYTLSAVARDAAGRETTATAVAVTVFNDVTAPTVSLTSPAAGQTVGGAVTVTANASDDVAITSVQFLLNGAPLGAADATAPYEAAWTTTTAANGAHSLTAVARDAAGHETTAAATNVTVLNDVAAPTVSITSPAANATVGGAVIVTANASDDIGVTNVQFLLDGVPLAVVDPTAPFEAAWSTTAAANGTHTLTAVARDAAGNETTATAINVTVLNDSAAPIVTVTSPAGDATVDGTVTVTANASDDIGVTSVQFLLDGAALGAADGAAPYEAAWSTTTAANGVHTLTAVARDAAGHESTAAAISVHVLNDLSAPTVSLTSPTADATVGGAVTIRANASDDVGVTSIQFLLDGAVLGAADTAAPFEAVWSTTTAANGSHTLAAVARDAAGHETTATAIAVTVFNDVTAPAVSVTNPAAASTINGAVTVTASASDDVSVASVQFLLDGAPLGAADSVPPYEAAWSTTGAANGAHTLAAVARDAAGHETTSTAIDVTVLNDLTAPSVAVINPVNGQTVSGMLTVGANASDDVGVTSVQFLLDGAPLGTPDTAVPFDATWLSTSTADGPHTVTAVARDAAGRETTSTSISVTVRNDFSAPAIALTAPTASAIVSGAVTVTANASDDVGVTSVQFMLDGAPLGAADSAAPYAAVWSTAAATNGAHTLTAVARDAAGQETTAAAITVTVANDAAAPVVSLTTPAASATVSGAVTVTANASDDIAVTNVQFMLDGAPLGAADTAAPYEAAWSTAAATNGVHTLTAVARDAAGNETIATAITVTVMNDTAAPAVTLINPITETTVAGAVTVLASAADDIGVVSVQFLLDGEPLGAVDTEAPYQTEWVTTAAVNGNHTLSVIARDAANNATTITATVTVANEPQESSQHVEAVSQ